MEDLEQPTATDGLDALLSLADEAGSSMHKAGRGKDESEKGDSDDKPGEGEEQESEDEEEREMMRGKKMRKQLRKYMKDNEDELNDAMNEMGYFKAQVSGAAQAAKDSDAPLTALDGTEIFKAFSSFADASLKMMKAMNDRLDGMAQMMEQSDELAKAEARVISGLSRRFEDVEATPIPRIGVTGQGAVQSGMQDGLPMTKAQSTPIHVIKSKLIKAAQDSGINSDRYQEILETVSHVEMSKTAEALSLKDLQIIEGVLA